jgi:glycosyltransferase involved in cell wall biosynthesis
VGYAGSVAAILAATATVTVNPVDRAGIRRLRGDASLDLYLPPFLDLAAFTGPATAGAPTGRPRPRLITVAMMRPGAKLASYRLLACALARVPAPDWELVVVGDGPARAEVEAAFAGIDPQRIRFVGAQTGPRVADWLRRSDLFVWPAIDEAFGMAFVEAQACGLPVVAGNAGGVSAVVAAGRTGLLVATGDVEAFAAGIRRLLTDGDLRQRMAREAAGYARAEHDLSVAATRLDALLRHVVARGKTGRPLADAAAATR